MSTLAERWIAAVEAAVELSTPREIANTIRNADAPDDGIRAATFEARVRSGHRADSHPERMALDDHPTPKVFGGWKDADVRAVSRQGLRFIDAINSINAERDPTGRSDDAGTVDNWDEAIQAANVMAELGNGGWVTSAIDVAHDYSPYHDTIDAVNELTTLAHRWGCPHVATIEERLRHPDQCLSHARIGVPREVHGRLVLCKGCRDLLAEVGDPHRLHRFAEHWPPPEMLRALEDGRRSDYRRHRAEWLSGEGVAHKA